MTIPEYVQLRAFARIDGLRLLLLWLASFASYVAGLRWPGWGMAGALLALGTPFVAYRRLCRFRDNALGGAVSFGRGWLYVLFVFFYASLLFAVAQFAYFSFIDNGFFMGALTDMFSDPQSAAALRRMGLAGGQLDEVLQAFSALRPADLVFNFMMSNLFAGCLLGVPVAAFARRGAGAAPTAGQ